MNEDLDMGMDFDDDDFDLDMEESGTEFSFDDDDDFEIDDFEDSMDFTFDDEDDFNLDFDDGEFGDSVVTTSPERQEQKGYYEALTTIVDQVTKFQIECSRIMDNPRTYQSGSGSAKEIFNTLHVKSGGEFSPTLKKYLNNIVTLFVQYFDGVLDGEQDFTVDDFLELPATSVGAGKGTIGSLAEGNREYTNLLQFLRDYKSKLIYTNKMIEERKSNNAAMSTIYTRDMLDSYKDTFEYIKILKQVLSQYREDENLKAICCYIKSYDVNTKTAVCGNCGETFKLDSDIFTSFLFARMSSDFQSIPSLNLCPNCKRLNILTFNEYRRLMNGATLTPGVKNQLIQRTEHLSPGYTYFKYAMGANKESEILGLDVSNHKPLSEDASRETLDLSGAVKRYKAMLRSFKTATPKPSVKGVVQNSNVATLAQFVARYVGSSYSRKKHFAVINIINHLSSSYGYGIYLRFSEYVRYEGILASEGIVDAMMDLTDDEFRGLAVNLYDILDVEVNLDTLNHIDRKVVCRTLHNKFSELRNEFEEFKEMRKLSLENISKYLEELSCLHVSQGSASSAEILDFMCCEDVRAIIDEWSDRMVIMDSLEDFSECYFASRKVFNSKFAANGQTSVDFFRAVSDKLDRRFQIQIEPGELANSLYPDNGVAPVLNKAIELHNAYSLDTYSFYMVLEEFIKLIPPGNRAFRRIFPQNLLGDIYSKVAATLNHYGRSEFGKLKYYFGSQFTDDEIEDAQERVYVANMNLSGYIPKRKDGEDFADYIKRVEALKDDLRTQDYEVVEDKLLPVIRKIYVALDVVYIIATVCLGHVKSVNQYFGYKSILNCFLKIDEVNILDILDVDVAISNDILNSTKSCEMVDCYDEYRDTLRNASYLFLDPEMNVGLESNDNVVLLEKLLNAGKEDEQGIGVDESTAYWNRYAKHLAVADQERLSAFIGSRE